MHLQNDRCFLCASLTRCQTNECASALGARWEVAQDYSTSDTAEYSLFLTRTNASAVEVLKIQLESALWFVVGHHSWQWQFSSTRCSFHWGNEPRQNR